MGENTTYEDRALHVKMFGGFDMTYLGKTLLGKKSGESQFVYMMQILLHNRENGISREVLEEVLFGDRDIENVHHAMQSVVYNAKKKTGKDGVAEGKLYSSGKRELLLDERDSCRGRRKRI